MQELRKDPLLDRWVLIAPERGARPSDFAPVGVRSTAADCPFCPGNELATPPEILAHRPPGAAANTPGWSLRVVPNRYPALTAEAGPGPSGDELTSLAPGFGAHEIIIESIEHEATIGELTAEHLAQVVLVYRDRMLAYRHPPFRYVMIFKNHGPGAGASLLHPHTQLLAMPLVPAIVGEELEAATHFHLRHRRCVFCELLARELAAVERVVAHNEHFVALCPWAARVPGEVWILPRAHVAAFEKHPPADLRQLAELLRSVALAIDRALARPSYNYLLHTLPFGDSRAAGYHWHLEVLPRTAGIGGFELGSGFFINTLPPEEAAGMLRQAATRDGGAAADLVLAFSRL